MSRKIDFSDMQLWLEEILKEKGFYWYDQFMNRTEEELLDSGVFTLGTIRNLSVHMEKRGLYFKNGMNSLSRLHLHKPGLKLLRNNGIYDLQDLEKITEKELALKIGFGYERTDFIASKMEQLGRPLRVC